MCNQNLTIAIVAHACMCLHGACLLNGTVHKRSSHTQQLLPSMFLKKIYYKSELLPNCYLLPITKICIRGGILFVSPVNTGRKIRKALLLNKLWIRYLRKSKCDFDLEHGLGVFVPLIQFSPIFQEKRRFL